MVQTLGYDEQKLSPHELGTEALIYTNSIVYINVLK